ncbi:MAG: hypothetical protein NZ765_09645 [Anaerolineae bacterium]|nr:hypothetical protein [Anaerolineae bacterium]MDW8071876.1 hypothetical protein [Anaerolineae bacterium]
MLGQSPSAYYEEPAAYVLDVSLSGNQERLDVPLFTDSDSEFILEALAGTSTGAYQIRVRLPNGRYMSNAAVRNANAVGSAQFPVPIIPTVTVPPGGRLGFDLKDLSGQSNTVQLVLLGRRRYRLS